MNVSPKLLQLVGHLKKHYLTMSGREDKESIDTLFGMGLTAYQAKDYTKAIHALEHLREHDPSYTTLYSYLAKSYEENGEPEKAIAVLKDGLMQDEFNKEMFMKLENSLLSYVCQKKRKNFIVRRLC